MAHLRNRRRGLLRLTSSFGDSASRDETGHEAVAAEPRRFTVLVVADGADRAVVVVAGKVDRATSEEFGAVLTEVGFRAPQLVVDVERVEFIDAAGVGALLDVARAARDTGGGLVLRRPSHAVQRVLALLCLEESFPVEGRADDAGPDRTGGTDQ